MVPKLKRLRIRSRHGMQLNRRDFWWTVSGDYADPFCSAERTFCSQILLFHRRWQGHLSDAYRVRKSQEHVRWRGLVYRRGEKFRRRRNQAFWESQPDCWRGLTSDEWLWFIWLRSNRHACLQKYSSLWTAWDIIAHGCQNRTRKRCSHVIQPSS